MATVTSLGAGSGLDLESLITKLMDAERTPLTALQTKQSSYNSQISALGSLKSKLADLQTAANGLKPSTGQSVLDKFASYSATAGDTTIASPTATTGAVAGSYSLVVTQLAQAQRSLSNAPPAVTPAIGDTLSFSFATNGATRNKTITIDSTNNSLSGLRDAINNANMGVSATIVNGTNGAQLILTGAEGAANAFTLTGTGNLASAFTTQTAAQDANFSVNGIASTSSTNQASGVIDGVTLNLSKTGATTVTVAKDNSTNLTTALNAFIKAYNDANSLMKTQGAYDQTTKTAGTLQGNSVLRDAQSSVRGLLFSTTSSGTSVYQRLSDIGVSVAADGSLKLDSTKLSSALAADANGVAGVIASTGTAYSNKLEQIVGSSGSIQIATDSTNKLVKNITDREAVLERRLTTIEARYRKQFTALDTLVAGMKQTSTYLTQQLATLPTASSSSK